METKTITKKELSKLLAEYRVFKTWTHTQEVAKQTAKMILGLRR